MSLRRKLVGSAVLLVVVGAGAGLALALQGLGGREREIPTARVRRGNLELKVHTTGELRPARTSMLVAPSVGGSMQILHLMKTGTLVKAGDLVIELDPSEQEYNLEQARSQLLQAEQEIIRSKAEASVQLSQDQVALLKAKFDVRRAELEVSRNELVGAIEGRKNQLNLEEARRRLTQLEKDLESRRASGEAAVAVLVARRNRERIAMQMAQQNIDNMKIKAPISGLVAAKENRDGVMFFFSGMTLPEYKEGDTVSGGRLIAEIMEVDQMEILAKVSEADRGIVSAGQPVEVQVDSIPGPVLSGRVKNVAGMAARSGWWGGDSQRKFDATFQLDRADDRLRPGISTRVIIVGSQVRDALYLPRQAIFEKDGKPVVYLLQGAEFESQEVKIAHRTESQVVVEGLAEGAEVALANPEKDLRKPGKAPVSSPSLGAGGK